MKRQIFKGNMRELAIMLFPVLCFTVFFVEALFSRPIGFSSGNVRHETADRARFLYNHLQNNDDYSSRPQDKCRLLTGIPYYRFLQIYDSSMISCHFGEAKITYCNGVQKSLRLEYHDPTNHAPICCDSFDNLADSSRTVFFHADEGAVISYYKDVNVEIYRPFITISPGIRDTILFVTQLVDSASGMVVEILDTMGIYPVSVVDSIINKMILLNDTSLFCTYTIPTGFLHDKIAIRVLPLFKGNPERDLLCRWDIFSSDLLSDQTQERLELLKMVIDSVLADSGISKRAQPLFVRDFDPTVREITISPNPAVKNATLTFKSLRYSGDLCIRLYDLTGNHVWTSNNISYQRGAEISFTLDVTDLSSGRYYAVPIVEDRMLLGKIVNVAR